MHNVGNPKAYAFTKPKVPGLDFSFSGLKRQFYFHQKKNPKES